MRSASVFIVVMLSVVTFITLTFNDPASAGCVAGAGGSNYNVAVPCAGSPPSGGHGGGTSYSVPVDPEKLRKEQERKRQKEESRQRVNSINNAIKDGDRYFSGRQYEAATRAYQRAWDICDVDYGFNSVFVDGTGPRCNYAGKQIEVIKGEKKLKAEEEERQRRSAEAEEKINKMVEGLKNDFSAEGSSAGTLDFPGASDVKAGQETTSLNFPEAPLTGRISSDKSFKAASLAPTKKGLRIKEVPSPYGYTSKQEREAQLKMLTLLSDEKLNRRIERTTRALEFMQSDFSGVEKTLNELVSEARDAEEQALMVSFKALAGAVLKLPKIKKADAKTIQRLRDLSDKGLTLLDYGGPVAKLNADPLDREANLEMARNLAGELHGILEEQGMAYFPRRIATELGTTITGFGGFIVDYTYEAGRWAVAASQIKSIIDNLDKPGGKLDAQLSLKSTLEDLMREKNRRKGEGR